MDSLELGLEDINRSILLNPDNGWAYRNKGVYFLKKGEYERSLELFNRAIDAKEFIDEIYYYMGQAYKGLGQDRDACDAWQKGKKEGEVKSVQALAGC